MAIDVETKDCTSLSDTELEEMADLCATGATGSEIGMLSKQAEAWVLVTLARQGARLKGFSFSTLERIGGTPSVIIGLASVQRSSKRDTVLRAIMADELRRAVLAFPDEDVLVGARLADPAGFEALRSLTDIVPRSGHDTTGEERAWGRRLAKRYGVGNGSYNDRSFRITGHEPPSCVLDHETSKPDRLDPEVVAMFDGLDAASGDALIAFGWAMAEDLARLA